MLLSPGKQAVAVSGASKETTSAASPGKQAVAVSSASKEAANLGNWDIEHFCISQNNSHCSKVFCVL